MQWSGQGGGLVLTLSISFLEGGPYILGDYGGRSPQQRGLSIPGFLNVYLGTLLFWPLFQTDPP